MSLTPSVLLTWCPFSLSLSLSPPPSSAFAYTNTKSQDVVMLREFWNVGYVMSLVCVNAMWNSDLLCNETITFRLWVGIRKKEEKKKVFFTRTQPRRKHQSAQQYQPTARNCTQTSITQEYQPHGTVHNQPSHNPRLCFSGGVVPCDGLLVFFMHGKPDYCISQQAGGEGGHTVCVVVWTL